MTIYKPEKFCNFFVFYLILRRFTTKTDVTFARNSLDKVLNWLNEFLCAIVENDKKNRLRNFENL